MHILLRGKPIEVSWYRENEVTQAHYLGVTHKGFDILCQNATPAALHGSSTTGNDPGCLYETRGEVQDHIFKWLDDLEGPLAMWMYGPAGSGKSAIAQTVAKMCADGGTLSSAFFFLGSDENRNSAKHLVATLAFEMVQQMPHLRDVVCVPIAKNPLIFSSPLERQIKTIILPALLEQAPACQHPPRGPILIIIDGLDECTDTGMQRLIIQTFIPLLASTTTPIRHKILIVSRPESRIVSTFSVADILPHVRYLCLEDFEEEPTCNIIASYIDSELHAMRQTHPLKSYLDTQWPSDESFRRLVDKSSGSLQYASLAVRYISSPDRHPETSLNNILDLDPSCAPEPYAEFDALYRHILESLDEKTRLTVLKAFCAWSLPPGQFILPMKEISPIIAEEPHALELALKKISSIVYFDTKCGLWFEHDKYDTSLNNFLVDKARSGVFYIYSPMVATTVAEGFLSRGLYEPPASIIPQGGEMMILAGFHEFPVDMKVHLLEAFCPSRLPKIYSPWKWIVHQHFYCHIECEVS